MDPESQPPSENELQESQFKSLVCNRQQLWRSLKKKPWEAFSQAVDLPESFTESIYSSFLDNLPAYIPQKTVLSLKRSHPVPILTSGVLMDQRFLTAPEHTVVFAESPEHLKNTADIQAWIKGIQLIDEYTTDTLAQETLKKMTASDSLGVNQLVRLGNTIRNLSRKMFPSFEVVGRYLEKNPQFDEIKQQLVITYLTGDKEKLNQQLQQSGLIDLDTLAVNIGRNHQYIPQMGWLKPKIGERLARSITNAGNASGPYAGVLNLSMIHSINSPHAVPATAIHEMSHYLGRNINHQGLIGFKTDSGNGVIK